MEDYKLYVPGEQGSCLICSELYLPVLIVLAQSVITTMITCQVLFQESTYVVRLTLQTIQWKG